MLNDGISIGAIVAVNLHDDLIISHVISTVYNQNNAKDMLRNPTNRKKNDLTLTIDLYMASWR